MKKILVATGTSVNKMKFAVETIKNYCAGKYVECEVKGVNIYEMKLEDENPDVLVVIGPSDIKTDIPIIMGTAFITKMGMDKTCDEILSHL